MWKPARTVPGDGGAGPLAALPSPRRRQCPHLRVAHADPQSLPMRRLRHRVEDARNECPAAVGLDDLDLEALARSERVGAERWHAAHPHPRCPVIATGLTEAARRIYQGLCGGMTR
jgi:hypothetical protein